jgi:WD40 repeat protein
LVGSDLEGHREGVTCLALSPDGTKLVSGSADFSVRVWDWQKGTLLNQFGGHGNQVYSVCFTPDGRWVLSGGYDNKVRLWDVTTGQEVGPAYEGYTQHIRCVAVFQTPDGLKALCAGLGNSVQILRLLP